MQKLKALVLEKHDTLWELARYVIAGALTTAVSLIVSYTLYFTLALGAAPAMEGYGAAAWAVEVINLATTAQVTIGNVASWIAAVLFAFWINRGMVFRVSFTDKKSKLTAFLQFVSARVVTLLLFELGLAALLSALGMPNIFARILVTVLVVIFNYVASKYWVFKKNEDAENSVAKRKL